MHADRSAARKAAEEAMLPFRDGPHLTTRVTAEAVWNLAVAMDALLAETVATPRSMTADEGAAYGDVLDGMFKPAPPAASDEVK